MAAGDKGSGGVVHCYVPQLRLGGWGSWHGGSGWLCLHVLGHMAQARGTARGLVDLP